MSEQEGNSPQEREQWERDLVTQLAYASIREQRRARRWGIFFKLLLFVYLFSLLFSYLPADFGSKFGAVSKHTAEVEINGVISDSSQASADNIIAGLRDAFKSPGTKGVVLRCNSPGGSPVQAADVYNEIMRLRKAHPKIPVYAVVSDMCASGGYYIISAADKIYASPASLVGSIGVLMDGFGFVDTLKKFGVERRLYTAGAHKGFMDPFSPVKPSDAQHLQAMLDDIHQQFIDAVKKGRGKRLDTSAPNLFSGWVWSGDEARKLGLIDGYGTTDSVARKVIGAKDVVDYTKRPDYFQRFADRIGATMAHTVIKTLGLEPGHLR